MRQHPIGIYEKALPKNTSWIEKLALTKACGFDFIEISIDETDERLTRLNWDKKERLALVKAIYETGIPIKTMCLSAHRRYPFGSHDPTIREQAKIIMERAFSLAQDLGIRTIQLAGYDVYYEKQTPESIELFTQSMYWISQRAAAMQITCAVEIMDTEFMNSISKWLNLSSSINSPWFTVYPDIGNLSAWGNDIAQELRLGINHISAIHLKDTYAVTHTNPGQFRDVPFGDGCVDFVKIFQELKQLNYRGTFLIEMWSEKTRDPLSAMINAKKWIENQMYLAGWNCHTD